MRDCVCVLAANKSGLLLLISTSKGTPGTILRNDSLSPVSRRHHSHHTPQIPLLRPPPNPLLIHPLPIFSSYLYLRPITFSQTLHSELLYLYLPYLHHQYLIQIIISIKNLPSHLQSGKPMTIVWRRFSSSNNEKYCWASGVAV